MRSGNRVNLMEVPIVQHNTDNPMLCNSVGDYTTGCGPKADAGGSNNLQVPFSGDNWTSPESNSACSPNSTSPCGAVRWKRASQLRSEGRTRDPEEEGRSPRTSGIPRDLTSTRSQRHTPANTKEEETIVLNSVDVLDSTASSSFLTPPDLTFSAQTPHEEGTLKNAFNCFCEDEDKTVTDEKDSQETKSAYQRHDREETTGGCCKSGSSCKPQGSYNASDVSFQLSSRIESPRPTATDCSIFTLNSSPVAGGGNMPSFPATGEDVDDSITARLIWVEHLVLGFAPGLIIEKIGSEIAGDTPLYKVELETGELVTVNAKDAVPVHPTCLTGIDDLLALGEFNMGPLLHNVRVRYFRNQIYTAVGPPILISVNPYTTIPNLYSVETAARYRGDVFGSFEDGNSKGSPSFLCEDIGSLPPHVFRIAQMALSNLFAGGADQSIIISGESGAGKTETTKIILGYLSALDHLDQTVRHRYFEEKNATRTTKRASSGGVPVSAPPLASHVLRLSSTLGVENQITQSNPVLESFGNAKTVRNDNSSRFGKFTQVFFDLEAKTLVGAHVSNYLLEKSRIVTQQEDERNYHIFYQLCAGRELLGEELSQWLGLDDAEAFCYTSRCTEVHGRDDYEDFQELLDCLAALRFSEEERKQIFSLLAAILHLGNVSLDPATVNENTRAAGEIDDAYIYSFHKACELFGILPENLLSLLRFKTIPDVTRQSKIVLERRKEDIVYTRDALCKAVYERLFQWLINRINAVLASDFVAESLSRATTPRPIGAAAEDQTTGSRHAGAGHQREQRLTTPSGGRRGANYAPAPRVAQEGSIGLLDIFGFEVFEVNSFEQLCINFANEQLQQHFNLHVFREEQILYQEEDIAWQHIQFEDNRRILDSLTNKVYGVFPVLDSECLMPGGKDSTFLSKMISRSAVCEVILKPTSLKAQSQFGIRHYAGEVYYDVQGMMEKNRDRVHNDVFDCFAKAETALLAELFQERYPAAPVLRKARCTGQQKEGYAARNNFSGASSSCSSTIDSHRGNSSAPRMSLWGGAQRVGGTTTPRPAASYGGPSSFSSNSTALSQTQTTNAGFANCTVSFTFRSQLSGLMEVLGMTTASYIRCIKPNGQKAPLDFDSCDILRQFKCAGMLESIRIRKAGYAIRVPVRNFLARYRVLLRSAELKELSTHGVTQDTSAIAKRLVAAVLLRCENDQSAGDPEPLEVDEEYATSTQPKWQIGKTKVFMKERLQFMLERQANAASHYYATKIAAHWRGFMLRQQYLTIREVVLTLQTFGHTIVARSHFENTALRRLHDAALVIQKAWRGWCSASAIKAKANEAVENTDLDPGRAQTTWLRHRSASRDIEKDHPDNLPLTPGRSKSYGSISHPQQRSMSSATLAGLRSKSSSSAVGEPAVLPSTLRSASKPNLIREDAVAQESLSKLRREPVDAPCRRGQSSLQDEVHRTSQEDEAALTLREMVMHYNASSACQNTLIGQLTAERDALKLQLEKTAMCEQGNFPVTKNGADSDEKYLMDGIQALRDTIQSQTDASLHRAKQLKALQQALNASRALTESLTEENNALRRQQLRTDCSDKSEGGDGRRTDICGVSSESEAQNGSLRKKDINEVFRKPSPRPDTLQVKKESCKEKHKGDGLRSKLAALEKSHATLTKENERLSQCVERLLQEQKEAYFMSQLSLTAPCDVAHITAAALLQKYDVLLTSKPFSTLSSQRLLQVMRGWLTELSQVLTRSPSMADAATKGLSNPKNQVQHRIPIDRIATCGRGISSDSELSPPLLSGSSVGETSTTPSEALTEEEEDEEKLAATQRVCEDVASSQCFSGHCRHGNHLMGLSSHRDQRYHDRHHPDDQPHHHLMTSNDVDTDLDNDHNSTSLYKSPRREYERPHPLCCSQDQNCCCLYKRKGNPVIGVETARRKSRCCCPPDPEKDSLSLCYRYKPRIPHSWKKGKQCREEPFQPISDDTEVIEAGSALRDYANTTLTVCPRCTSYTTRQHLREEKGEHPCLLSPATTRKSFKTHLKINGPCEVEEDQSMKGQPSLRLSTGRYLSVPSPNVEKKMPRTSRVPRLSLTKLAQTAHGGQAKDNSCGPCSALKPALSARYTSRFKNGGPRIDDTVQQIGSSATCLTCRLDGIGSKQRWVQIQSARPHKVTTKEVRLRSREY